jgi:hypothetical protein
LNIFCIEQFALSLVLLSDGNIVNLFMHSFAAEGASSVKISFSEQIFPGQYSPALFPSNIPETFRRNIPEQGVRSSVVAAILVGLPSKYSAIVVF